MNYRETALIPSPVITAGQGKKTSAHTDLALVAAPGQWLLLVQLLLPDKVYEGRRKSAQAEKRLRKRPSCFSFCAYQKLGLVFSHSDV